MNQQTRIFQHPELIFDAALDAFLKTEGTSLFSDVSERNTCGRLALYLERQIEVEGAIGYYADVEYNRKQNAQVKTVINDDFRVIPITPDVIVHSRGKKLPPNDNLIAVEMKKSNRPQQEKDDDKMRLILMSRESFDEVWGWDGSHPEHVCAYALGVYVEIDIANRTLHLEYYKNGRETKSRSVAL